MVTGMVKNHANVANFNQGGLNDKRTVRIFASFLKICHNQKMLYPLGIQNTGGM